MRHASTFADRPHAMHAALLACVFLCSALCSAQVRPLQAVHPPVPPVAVPPPPAAAPATGTAPGPRGSTKDRAAQQSGLQLGPAGRWWDDRKVAKAVGLKPEQRQRMDTVFESNKTALYTTYRALKTEEAKLDTLQRAESPDESAILAQIDRVTALRGQLTKSSASLVLQLRKELTPEQLQKLQAQ